MSKYKKGDPINIVMKDGTLEEWQVHNVFPNQASETDPDVLFFTEEMPKVVNGEFSFIQYHPEEDQWEAVITMKCRKITREKAEAVDRALVKRYGTNWKLWIHSHIATKDLHVIYWS